MSQTEDLTVELYVRTDAPLPERRSNVIDQLRRLEDRDQIAAFGVHAWPSSVSLDLETETPVEWIPRAFRSFEQWADRTGMNIDPFFQIQQVHSTITDESDELLRLPVICLGIYREQNLLGVYPSHRADRLITVEDALDALETGTLPVESADAGEQAPSIVEGAETFVANADDEAI